MNRFDDRWQELVSAARRDSSAGAERALDVVGAEDGRIDAARADRIAKLAAGRLGRRRTDGVELGGLVIAASLFGACVLGFAWSHDALGYGPSIDDARNDLARLARHIPSTSFIPPPPRPGDFGLPNLAEFEPALAGLPGAGLFTSFDEWLHPTPTTPETSR